MTLWRRLLSHRPIVTRLVVAVAPTMAVVLLATGAFVFWRVEFALNRQLDQDLKAYQEVVEKAVADGNTPPSDTPGQSYQVYDTHGRVIGGNARGRIVDRETVAQAAAGTEQRETSATSSPPPATPTGSSPRGSSPQVDRWSSPRPSARTSTTRRCASSSSSSRSRT